MTELKGCSRWENRLRNNLMSSRVQDMCSQRSIPRESKTDPMHYSSCRLLATGQSNLPGEPLGCRQCHSNPRVEEIFTTCEEANEFVQTCIKVPRARMEGDYSGTLREKCQPGRKDGISAYCSTRRVVIPTLLCFEGKEAHLMKQNLSGETKRYSKLTVKSILFSTDKSVDPMVALRNKRSLPFGLSSRSSADGRIH